MSDQENEGKRGHNRIRFSVVTTQQQLIEAYVVRCFCFVHEQSMKMSLILDENDSVATHLLIYDENEPIGSLRIRWFGQFAKIERTCIRKEWRNPRLLKDFATFAFGHIARKGFNKVVTYANPQYATLWQRFLGFRPVVGKAPFRYEGHDESYIELERLLDVPDDAITASSDASLIFRTEGRWEEPLPFEATEAR